MSESCPYCRSEMYTYVLADVEHNCTISIHKCKKCEHYWLSNSSLKAMVERHEYRVELAKTR